jgi:tetratricopeptide (TPR) repeat protein
MRGFLPSLAVLSLVAAIGGCGSSSSTDVDDASDPQARLAEAQSVLHGTSAASALSMINAIVRDHPDFLEAYLCKGRLHHQRDMLDEALAAVERAIKLNPDCGQAYLDRAIYLRELGREQEALEALERAQQCAIKLIETNAFALDAKLDLVMVAHLRGNTMSALDQIDLILADRPYSNKAKVLKRFLEGKIAAAAD